MIVVRVSVGYYSAFIESQPLGTLVLLCFWAMAAVNMPRSELGCWHRTVAWSDGCLNFDTSEGSEGRMILRMYLRYLHDLHLPKPTSIVFFFWHR